MLLIVWKLLKCDWNVLNVLILVWIVFADLLIQLWNCFKRYESCSNCLNGSRQCWIVFKRFELVWDMFETSETVCDVLLLRVICCDCSRLVEICCDLFDVLGSCCGLLCFFKKKIGFKPHWSSHGCDSFYDLGLLAAVVQSRSVCASVYLLFESPWDPVDAEPLSKKKNTWTNKMLPESSPYPRSRSGHIGHVQEYIPRQGCYQKIRVFGGISVAR